MFHNRLLARVLSTVALAGLALSFAPAALAQFLEEEMFDPGAPPSEFPDHSGEMNNFGSTFIFSFSDPHTDAEGSVIFAPSATINCMTCSYPVAAGSSHTFSLTGQVIGKIRGNDGEIVPNSAGVYNMNITISGAKATVSAAVHRQGDSFFEQSIRYTADLKDGGAVSGELELDGESSVQPIPLPPADGEGRRIIRVAAQDGVTDALNTDATAGPLTFPAVPASSPSALGQDVPANVVFQVTETKRVPCSRDPSKCPASDVPTGIN